MGKTGQSAIVQLPPRKMRRQLHFRGLSSDSVFPVFTRTSARTFVTDDRASLEDLAAPCAPGCGPFQRRRQALATDRAARAERLGALQASRSLGEPQVGIADMT